MPAPPDDHALVAAAQAGDRVAIDRLLRAHYDRIYGVCRRITGNDADAADAAQEALLAIVRGLGRFDGRSAFGTWVYRIATNASLDELRRRRRRPLLAVMHGDAHHRDAHDRGPAEPADVVPAHSGDGAAERLADRLLLETALLALPDEFRVAVVLRDVADLDYAAIAEVLELPVGTVKSRIARGRGQLAASLRSDTLGAGNQTDTNERPTAVPRTTSS